MRPKKHETTGSNDLWARLDQIINMKPLYSGQGRPGISTRFVLGLLLLNHIYALSDEGVCNRWSTILPVLFFSTPSRTSVPTVHAPDYVQHHGNTNESRFLARGNRDR
jgi:hypothetical protein